MSASNYAKQRELVEQIRQFENFMRQKGIDGNKYIEHLKQRLRFLQHEHKDWFTSNRKEWHTRCLYDDGTSWIEYRIFEDEGESDEQIQSMINDMWIEIHSAYDCTGKPFTQRIHWSRQPVGIVVVHRLGLDV